MQRHIYALSVFTKAALCVRSHIFVTAVDHGQFLYERALFWNFPKINQMTFKVPYVGRWIKYYTVPVVSCILLGRFGGFWFCHEQPCNKDWQGRPLFPTVTTTPLAFSQKCLTSASCPPVSFDDVEAKMCPKSRHSVDSKLGKILIENHVSFEFKFQTMIGTEVVFLCSSHTWSF